VMKEPIQDCCCNDAVMHKETVNNFVGREG
jgi:hypothetical protein